MMRERRFRGGRSPPRGREYSPPRGRDRRNGSPIRASIQNGDYMGLRTGSPTLTRTLAGAYRDPRPGSPTRTSMRQPNRDYQDLRTGSPTRARMQGRAYRNHRIGGSPTQTSMQGQDYSRPYHEFPSSISSEMEKSRRVLGSERPGGSIDRGDCGRHLDGDEDRQLRKLPLFNGGLSQGESTSMKFQWKHLLDKHKRTGGNSNHSSSHFPDYGVGNSSARVSNERNYQASGLADIGSSGMTTEKPIPMEIERNITFPSYSPASGTRRSSIDIDSGVLSLPSQKLNISLHKDEHIRFQDYLSADKLSARKLFEEEEIPKFYSREEPHYYSRDTSHYAIPLSQSKASATVPFGSSLDDHCCSHDDGFLIRSNGFNRSSGVLTVPSTCEAYTHSSRFKSSRDPNMNLEDMKKYRQVHVSPNNGTQRGYACPEVRISEKSEIVALSDQLCWNVEHAEDVYGLGDSLELRSVEPIMDRIVAAESSHREHLIEGRLWGQHCSSQEQPIPNYLDATGSSCADEKDGEVLDHKRMHLEHEMEVCQGGGNNYLGEDRGYGRDACLQSDEDRLNMLTMTEYDPGWDGIDNKHQEEFIAEELGLHEHPKMILKRKRDVDKINGRQNWGKKFSTNRKISGKTHDSMSNKSLFKAPQYRKFAWFSNGLVGPRNSNSDASGRLSACNPMRLKSGVGDIKKRLGPVPRHLPIPHTSAKKYKQHKYLRRSREDYDGSIHADVGSLSEGDLVPVKSEPSENSDFKQQVHSAFFKFVKQLNENPMQRRRLKEQGKAGSLKCSICGSASEEFLDTESLVMHTCTAPKVGFRAQHLGFHKALCSLMGWKSAETPPSQWVRQLLPDAENVALKEDLIIWPPVVIIHNSSIGNTNPDGRVIVSVDMLETILRDMGFGKKAKVCRGKPANQSIMVVRFSGTFSGLQEAERLHKVYADREHGRTEFKQINSNSCTSGDGETQIASANKVEHALYGYLGIAEDLDKLDFEAKKRCLVRSKKEIQDIADAPLKTE